MTRAYTRGEPEGDHAMASDQAELLKGMMRQFKEAALGRADGPPITVAQMRGSDAMMATMATEPTGVTYTEVDANGVPAMWVTPDGPTDGTAGDPVDDSKVVMYLHGGGYVIGSIVSHARLVGHIAKAAGIRALNVDYRLAPEAPHPAAVTDAVTAYRWLLDQGIAADKIVIAGDSAGGGLTIATLLAIRDQGLAHPGAAVTLSPWIDLEGTGDSMTSRAHVDLMVDGPALKVMADMYLNGQSPHDPLAAPLHADFTGLPPIYIQVGDEETLLDDSSRLAERAGAAGVDVRIEVFPEMQHVFQMSVGNLPEADEAVAKIGAYIRQALS